MDYLLSEQDFYECCPLLSKLSKGEAEGQTAADSVDIYLVGLANNGSPTSSDGGEKRALQSTAKAN